MTEKRLEEKMKQNQMWLNCLCMGVFWFCLSTATVQAGCRVSTTSINFGNYDVFSAVPTTGTGSITLSCTPKADVSIAIGASSNSGSFHPRMMKLAGFGDTLEYNLYTSPARIQVWGNGTNGTATTDLLNVRNTNTPPIIIYGKIVPLQNVSPGSYSEQLVVTITY